jgi:hypothetical protein
VIKGMLYVGNCVPWDGSGKRGGDRVSCAGDKVEDYAFHSLSMDSVGQDEGNALQDENTDPLSSNENVV